MKPSRKSSESTARSTPAAGGADRSDARKDLQPPATGANKGSPAAPVMKQFQKTRAESSGRS